MADIVVKKSVLTSEQEDIIRQTLPVVGENIGDIAANFYKRMFAAHPDLLAHTFNRGNQKQGAQQKALAASVATFAATLIDPEAPAPIELLRRIGHKHISVGIVEEQYAIVHKHLFDAIEEILTPDVFQGAIREAWDSVYLAMQQVLVDFEKEAYAERGVKDGDVFRAAKVVKREDLSNDVVRFTVQLDDGQTPAFLPGQYISVRQTMSDGAGQLRQYSLVNASGASEGLTFAVRRVDASAELPAGEVSTQLVEKVQEGDAIEVSLPAGDLILDLDSSDPVVLVSAGIGATPMVGMLSALVAQGSTRNIVVLHADRSEAADVLSADRAECVAKLENATERTWYEPEFMNLEDVDIPADAEIYICGGNGFLQAVREQLVDKGIERERVHFELFSPNDWLLDA